MTSGTGEVILVADNEPDIREFVKINLELEGFDVVVADDGLQALDRAMDLRPSLVILDVMMPGLDGFEVCRRLRTDIRTNSIPVIILTAKSMTADKVVGLTAGADDYVLKPFDPTELIARVRTTLRRARELRATSPLTGLPGNHVIERELARRHAEGEDVALVYADLNDFKPYNDYYGFLRGDDVIRMTADVLQGAVAKVTTNGAFVGHIGGDDFMVACHPEEVLALCDLVIAEFDNRVPGHYEAADWQRGYLELPDRQGGTRRSPHVSIALGVATTRQRGYRDYREIVSTATEMKTYLKAHYRRSAYAIDGRASEPPAPDAASTVPAEHGQAPR